MKIDYGLIREIEHRNEISLHDILADLNDKGLLEEGLEYQDAEGTALHHAVKKDWLPGVSRLIQAGANIETKNKRGDTSLVVAIRSYAYDAAKILIKNQADIHVKDSRGMSLLHILVDLLKENLFMPEIYSLAQNNTGAEVALIRYQKELLNSFTTAEVIAKKLINSIEYQNESNLYDILENSKNKNLLKEVLQHEEIGLSVLFYAIQAKWLTGIAIILEAGADTETKNGYEETALQYAIKILSFSAVPILIKYKADIRSLIAIIIHF